MERAMSDQVPEGQETAVAVVVAPERMEDAIVAIPPERMLPTLWWLDEVIRRANAAKRALLIEASVALAHGEIDPRLVVADHRYELRQDERTVWEDLGGLIGMLESVHGVPGDLLRASLSEARVTDLRGACAKIGDPEMRKDALETIEQHRVRKPTQMALVDLDSPREASHSIAPSSPLPLPRERG